MNRDTQSLVEDFEHRGGEAHIEADADEVIRHRVITPFDFEVIIGMNFGALPFAVLVGMRR